MKRSKLNLFLLNSINQDKKKKDLEESNVSFRSFFRLEQRNIISSALEGIKF